MRFSGVSFIWLKRGEHFFAWVVGAIQLLPINQTKWVILRDD
jgi:hypothetical protein